MYLEADKLEAPEGKLGVFAGLKDLTAAVAGVGSVKRTRHLPQCLMGLATGCSARWCTGVSG